MLQGKHSRNKDLDPFTSTTDKRLTVKTIYTTDSTFDCTDDVFLLILHVVKWLETDFTNYLKDWEAQAMAFSGTLTAAQRDKMMLAKSTMEGLYIIGRNALLIYNCCYC